MSELLEAPLRGRRLSEDDLAGHVEEFARDGVTVVNDVVSEVGVAELRAAVDRALVDDRDLYAGRPGKADFICLDLVTHGGPFLRFLENQIYDQFYGRILGEKWILYSFTSTVVQPDVAQYTCEIHTDTNRHVPTYDLGALGTLALDDFTFDNGTTWFLKGSHLLPDQPSEDEFYERAVRFERPAGSVAFFHPRVWHAGGVNTTGATRSGCTTYACRSFMRPRLDFARLTADQDLSEIGDHGRRVLGYDVRVPVSLDEFYVDPEHRLYKGGQG